MTDQIDVLKAELLKKRNELPHLVRSQYSQLTIGDGEHELLDQMQGTRTRDEASVLLNTLTRTLGQVDAALMAIELGVYGICVECDEPISARRLQVLPWAARCIRCQGVLDCQDQVRRQVPRWDVAA